MKKKLFAFYDVLLYAIICGPLLTNTTLLLLQMISQGVDEWVNKSIHLLVLFALSIVLPMTGISLIRYCLVENELMHFHYFPFTFNWDKASDNIDICWNQDVFIPEVKNVECVKLTGEQKKSKVFYRHWFNKYLKVNLKYGNPKYIYVGNYSDFQIRKIIGILTIPD